MFILCVGELWFWRTIASEWRRLPSSMAVNQTRYLKLVESKKLDRMYLCYCLYLKYAVYGMYMIKVKIMIKNNNESEGYQFFFLTNNSYILNMSLEYSLVQNHYLPALCKKSVLPRQNIMLRSL